MRPGAVTGFLGPNGAGKTTTLRMLLGLTRATSGRALVGDRPYAALERPGRIVEWVVGIAATVVGGAPLLEVEGDGAKLGDPDVIGATYLGDPPSADLVPRWAAVLVLLGYTVVFAVARPADHAAPRHRVRL